MRAKRPLHVERPSKVLNKPLNAWAAETTRDRFRPTSLIVGLNPMRLSRDSLFIEPRKHVGQ